MTSKKEILSKIVFGSQVAEEEKDELQNYFVETDNWNKLFEGGIDVIYGPKGSGKSALYSLLLSKQNTLFDRNVLLLTAEKPRGSTVFSSLTTSPPTSEQEFIGLWKLYIICLLHKAFKEYSMETDNFKQLSDILSSEGLVFEKTNTLKDVFNGVRAYVNRIFNPSGLEGGIQLDPLSGTPAGVTGKIIFSDSPNAAQVSTGKTIDIEYLVDLANKNLEQYNISVWILYDRLDVAFQDHEQLESNALRALFRTYLDFKSFDYINLKIFLRSDIWQRITEQGFREASHITRSVNITWEKNSLLNLIIRRLVANEPIRTYYKIDFSITQSSPEKQEEFLYKVFPEQVDVGPKSPSTLNWMLSRTHDASNLNAPRELIHLLNALREKQVKRIEIGESEPEGKLLFSRSTFKEALKDVSKVRLEQTLFAEYPQYKPCIEQLRRQKTRQSISSLSKIWGIPVRDTRQQANSLCEIGFFLKDADETFWVPFIYRDALEMVQGTA